MSKSDEWKDARAAKRAETARRAGKESWEELRRDYAWPPHSARVAFGTFAIIAVVALGFVAIFIL